MKSPLAQEFSSALRIAVVGPESTGKTTICQMLSKAYAKPWVQEYMRAYLQQKWDNFKQKCTPADMLPIAIGQMQAENEVAANSSLIFCDTNLFELMTYSYIYYGYCEPHIEKYAKENHYDVVFLTDIDVPWQADDLRDRPNARAEIFTFFKQKLEHCTIPYVLLSGNEQLRMQQAKGVIDEILSQKQSL